MARLIGNIPPTNPWLVKLFSTKIRCAAFCFNKNVTFMTSKCPLLQLPKTSKRFYPWLAARRRRGTTIKELQLEPWNDVGLMLFPPLM